MRRSKERDEMPHFLIDQTETGVELGVYAAEDGAGAIRAMLEDAGAPDAEPDPGLRARRLPFCDVVSQQHESSCETCGRRGWVTSYARNPDNRLSEVWVLCVDANGKTSCFYPVAPPGMRSAIDADVSV